MTPRKPTLLLILAAVLSAPADAPAQAAPPPPQQQQQQRPADAPRPQADDEVARARMLLARGDAAGAAALLKPVAERRKTDADAWYYLGLAHSRANRQKDARKAFEKAVGLRDSAPARTGLAFTQFLLGKTRDAEREVGRALALDPGSAQAHYVLAAIYFRSDRLEESVREADEALRLDPNFHAAAALSGEALLNLYGAESERAAQRHPIPADADDAARAAALDGRHEMLASAKARLHVAAERLKAIADALPAGRAKEDWGELAATLKFYAAPRKKGDPPDVFRQAEVGTRAVITSKPAPGFTAEARHNGTSGAVRLSAVLWPDGRVRHIVVMRRLPDGLTEQAVGAARQIRFTPATLGGRRVAQIVVLEYNFAIR